ncbi:MAG: hypothetical protein GY854_01380 [Deltaproteobacteria bacterium]|nr:hypothetical protein [Deltaproteobacteria bacterium]
MQSQAGDWIAHDGGETGVFAEIYYRIGDVLGFVIHMNGEGKQTDNNPIYKIDDCLYEFAADSPPIECNRRNYS